MIDKENKVDREKPENKYDMVINGTHIRVRSVFNGSIPLEKALGNLVLRKISDKKSA